jgi:outer membrane protein OmpA-like peptidoglycan-associated protein
MSFNLIDSVKGLLGADLVPKASARLHENETSVQNAMSGIVPAVLAGIIHKAGSGDAGRVLGMAKDTANSNMLSGISNLLSNNSLLENGIDLLKGIFGGRMNDVVNLVSNYFGIKSSSASSLMSVAAPAALGAIGVHANSTNMNERSFLSFLDDQKESVINALPSGFNLAGALGLSSIGNIGGRLTGEMPGATVQTRDIAHTVKRKPSRNWVMPVVVILAALGLVWFFSNLKNTKSKDTTMATQTEPGRIGAPPPAGETVKVQLPNGVELNAYRNGIESQMVNFLNDPARMVDNNTWFDFDKLNFETGSSMITSESMTQIRNIAAILKAYPNASIKIGGYTDATGNEPANLKLSQARAEAVVAELRSNGVTDAQLAGAEGYGSKFAKAAAGASDEERKKDRRISVSIRKK